MTTTSRDRSTRVARGAPVLPTPPSSVAGPSSRRSGWRRRRGEENHHHRPPRTTTTTTTRIRTTTTTTIRIRSRSAAGERVPPRTRGASDPGSALSMPRLLGTARSPPARSPPEIRPPRRTSQSSSTYCHHRRSVAKNPHRIDPSSRPRPHPHPPRRRRRVPIPDRRTTPPRGPIPNRRGIVSSPDRVCPVRTGR